MLASSRRAGLLATVAALVGTPLVPLACAKTTVTALPEDTAAVQGSDAQPLCPASLTLALTAGCESEGASCSYLVPCEPIAASASCVCSGGQYACAVAGDGGGAITTVDGGALNLDVCPVLATTELCPLSEFKAQGLFCNEPGLICDYPSTCDSTPAYDTCECVGGRDDAEGPHFQCNPACEETFDGSPAPVSDAAIPDATATEAGVTDAAPPIDGAVEQ
jgi:hypothetical protein